MDIYAEDEKVFVAAVLDRYQAMTDAQRNKLLESLIHKSSFNQLYYVHGKLKSLCHYDFITLLPQEMSEIILSFCDDATLFAACQVSKQWNCVISSDKVWRHRCKKFGLTTTKAEESILRNRNENCKMTYHRMSRLMRSLRKGTALTCHIFKYHPTILRSSISFDIAVPWEKNVVLATTGKLMVWNFVLDTMVAEQNTPNSDYTILIKCCENITLVSLMSGTLMTFALPSLRPLQTYAQHVGPVFGFDFDVTLDMVASGSLHGVVKLWSFSKGGAIRTLSKHSKNVVQVIIRSSPDSAVTEDAVLITASCDIILVWTVPWQLSIGDECGQRNVTCIAEIPYYTMFRADVFLHGKHLYYTKTGDLDNEVVHTDILCKYDVVLNREDFQRELSMQIIRILGVGTKYMCAYSRTISEGIQFQIVDIDSGTLISKIDVTTVGIYHMGTPPVAFGCPNWLDGFNGLNNNSVVLSIANHENVELFKWKPEFRCPDFNDGDN